MHSEVRMSTRFFSWPSGQIHPKKLFSGPEDVLADGQEHLLRKKCPSAKYRPRFQVHTISSFMQNSTFRCHFVRGAQGVSKVLAKRPKIIKCDSFGPKVSTWPTSGPKSMQKAFRPRFGHFRSDENHKKCEKSGNVILLQKNPQVL